MTFDYFATYAPHELLGPLPKDWSDRVQMAHIMHMLNQVPQPEPYWCTATRADGEPCAGYRKHGSEFAMCAAHERQQQRRIREATR